MSARPKSLFGVPEAEVLYPDIATVWETDIEPYHDGTHSEWFVEEFTVADPASEAHCGSPRWTVENVAERFCDEWWEYPFDERFPPETDERCLAAARLLHDAVAALVVRHMAEDRVAIHRITLDEDGQPLVEGEPMYRAREQVS